MHHNHGLIPDTVLFTHAHNDHIAGLGDYADLCFWNKVNSRIVGSPEVISQLVQRYPYLANRDSIKFFGCKEFTLGEWYIQFVKVNHGHNGYSYGLVFSKKDYRWAYVSDSFNMTEEQLSYFLNLDTLILGTSYWEEKTQKDKRSVYSVTEAFEIKEILKPTKMVLTHLSHDINADIMSKQLPENVFFAFDGMELQF